MIEQITKGIERLKHRLPGRLGPFVFDRTEPLKQQTFTKAALKLLKEHRQALIDCTSINGDIKTMNPLDKAALAEYDAVIEIGEKL